MGQNSLFVISIAFSETSIYIFMFTLHQDKPIIILNIGYPYSRPVVLLAAISKTANTFYPPFFKEKSEGTHKESSLRNVPFFEEPFNMVYSGPLYRQPFGKDDHLYLSSRPLSFTVTPAFLLYILSGDHLSTSTTTALLLRKTMNF